MSASTELVKRALAIGPMLGGAALAGGAIYAVPKLIEALMVVKEQQAAGPAPDMNAPGSQFGGLDPASERWLMNALLAGGLKRRQMQNAIDAQNEFLVPGWANKG